MPERLMLGIAYEPYKFKCRDKKKNCWWLSDVLDRQVILNIKVTMKCDMKCYLSQIKFTCSNLEVIHFEVGPVRFA